MCCKKGRALSCGETDRELKSWMLQATRGRYQSPSRKTAMDTLLNMRAKIDNELTKELRALLDERISPSISGNLACPICCCCFLWWCFCSCTICCAFSYPKPYNILPLNLFISRFDIYSLVGDIWSENGISLFAVIVHYIDKDWILNTKLAICKGMGDLAHTGDTIKNSLTMASTVWALVSPQRVFLIIYTQVHPTRGATCWPDG